MDRIDHVLFNQKRDHARIQVIQQALDIDPVVLNSRLFSELVITIF